MWQDPASRCACAAPPLNRESKRIARRFDHQEGGFGAFSIEEQMPCRRGQGLLDLRHCAQASVVPDGKRTTPPGSCGRGGRTGSDGDIA